MRYKIYLITSFILLVSVVGCGIGVFLFPALKTALVLGVAFSLAGWLITGNIACYIYSEKQ